MVKYLAGREVALVAQVAKFEDVALPKIGRASARDRIVPRMEAALKWIVSQHSHDPRYHTTFAVMRDAIDAIKDLERFLINR